MNRVRKIARKWEEEGREGSLKIHEANKADTRRRKLKYCKEVEPRGVVQVDPIIDFAEGIPDGDGTLSVNEAIEMVPLEDQTVPMLRITAKAAGLTGYSKANRATLIDMIQNRNKENSNEQ